MTVDTGKRDRMIGAAVASGRLPLDQAPAWAAQWDETPGSTERALEKMVENPGGEVSEDEMVALFGPRGALPSAEPKPTPSAEPVRIFGQSEQDQ